MLFSHEIPLPKPITRNHHSITLIAQHVVTPLVYRWYIGVIFILFAFGSHYARIGCICTWWAIVSPWRWTFTRPWLDPDRMVKDHSFKSHTPTDIINQTDCSSLTTKVIGNYSFQRVSNYSFHTQRERAVFQSQSFVVASLGLFSWLANIPSYTLLSFWSQWWIIVGVNLKKWGLIMVSTPPGARAHNKCLREAESILFLEEQMQIYPFSLSCKPLKYTFDKVLLHFCFSAIHGDKKWEKAGA